VNEALESGPGPDQAESANRHRLLELAVRPGKLSRAERRELRSGLMVVAETGDETSWELDQLVLAQGYEKLVGWGSGPRGFVLADQLGRRLGKREGTDRNDWPYYFSDRIAPE
jgi:hypothetical protein